MQHKTIPSVKQMVLNTSNLSSVVPVVSARQQDATEVRVFMLDVEKEELKQACLESGIQMSHQIRLLILDWLRDRNLEQIE